jgi:hypothetical protein
MAYGWDGVDGRMMISTVLRYGLSSLDNQTWTFDGANWTTVPSPSVVTRGTGRVLVFDSKRGRVVLVMTVNESVNPQVQTWEWNGVTWHLQSTRHAPGLSQFASGAYSPELGATVLLDAPHPTWLYNGTDWRSVATAVHQPARLAHLEYDVTRKALIALSLSDFRTWRFDGIDWTPLALNGPTPALPSGLERQAPSVGLDQKRQAWIVFGGFDGYNRLADTWTGDGTSWTKQAPAHAPNSFGGVPGKNNLAWDPVGSRLLLFGGMNSAYGSDSGETWAWDGTDWSQVA